MNLINGFLITCKATLLVCFTSHIQMDNAMINIHMDKDNYFYAICNSTARAMFHLCVSNYSALAERGEPHLDGL